MCSGNTGLYHDLLLNQCLHQHFKTSCTGYTLWNSMLIKNVTWVVLCFTFSWKKIFRVFRDFLDKRYNTWLVSCQYFNEYKKIFLDTTDRFGEEAAIWVWELEGIWPNFCCCLSSFSGYCCIHTHGCCVCNLNNKNNNSYNN